MLTCPQCEFGNPEAHKYCQNCGTSLTLKLCHQCQASIPMEAEICSFCGKAHHTALWAIISQKKAATKRETREVGQTLSSINNDQKQAKIENLSTLSTKEQDKILATLQIQSDHENSPNRYAIQEILSPKHDLQSNSLNIDSDFLQAKVVDKYPWQQSHLAKLQQQQPGIFTDLSNSYLTVTQYWNLIGLPTHALPYLILARYTPVIPKIYDAWQQQNHGIVLVPDRTGYQLLTEFWLQQELQLLQIIWFLDEMAKLWEPLQQISCARSLLVHNNLRVDEDQAFCLQQLYLDRLDAPPTLKDLAKTWQLWLAQSNPKQLNNLNQLLECVISGEIIEIEQLRLELHNLGLGEDEMESFDIHLNYSDVNIPQSQPDNIQPNYDSETTEQANFFEQNEEDMMYSSEFEEQATAVVPMRLRSVTNTSCTDIGSQRDHNEDFFGVKTTIEQTENNSENNISVRGLYLVCDGMGGHAAGEVASAMAVENLQKYFQTQWQKDLPDHKTIEKGILLANEALYQTNIDNSRSGSGRMGTTLVMALLQDTQLAIAHVGDSRIYRITRKQGLEQLTLDHEVGQREINRGVEPDIAYGRPDAYQLTQALGPRENNYVRPDIQFMEVTEDCLLLLCSDGLSDNDLLEENWQQYLEPLISSSSDLQEGIFKLVNFANQHNGHDNITAVLVRIKLKPDF